MDPKGPAQPSLNTAYNVEGNPTQKEPAEEKRAAQKLSSDDPAQERRQPTSRSNESHGTPTSQGMGIRGAPAGEEANNPDATDEQYNKGDLEGEQMRAPGEGEVSQAVSQERKPGAGGEQKDLMGDIGRKAEEQKGMRNAIEGNRDREEGREGGGVDVGAALKGRGTTAN